MPDEIQRLYRYFSLPAGLVKTFEVDQIVINKDTTINDVLYQKSKLQAEYLKKLFIKIKKNLQETLLNSLVFIICLSLILAFTRSII